MNDILTGIPVAEGVIPESVETFSEAANYVIENTQDEFRELLEDEGIVDENGQIVLDESADDYEDEAMNEGVGDVKDRFVEVLQSAWSSIKAWFEKVIKWFKEKAAKAKEFLDAQVEKIQGKLDDLHQARINKKFKDVKVEDVKEKAKLGKAHEFSKLENVAGKYSGFIDKGLNELEASFKRSKVAVNDIMSTNPNVQNIEKGTRFSSDTKGASFKTESLTQYKDAVKKIIAELPGKLAGGDTRMSVSVMRSEIKKDLTGKEIEYTGANIKGKYKDMLDVVLYNSTQKQIKVLYNEARKAIKESISKAKKMKGKSNAAKTVKATTVSALKSVNMILHAAHSAVMDVCKQRYNEYMRVLSAVARISGKAERERKRKERKKKTNASTEFESLFDF